MTRLSSVPAPLSGRDGLARALTEAALAGARALMPLWRAAIAVETKKDGSLVSAADHAADAAVREALAGQGLAWPLVSEEAATPRGDLPDRFLLLDPLDGTSEFLDHGAEFCVCLAAVENGRATAGAIVAPALRRGWFGGRSAFALRYDWDLAETACTALSRKGQGGREGLTGLVSRRHGDARSDADLAGCQVSNSMTLSSAIKYGYLAEKQADIHIRHGRTMAWDIAAGDAILSAAGGAIRTFDGAKLDYGRGEGDFGNPPFVAVSREALLADVLQAVRRPA